MALQPTSWIELGEHTFRWQRGDEHMVVLRGTELGATWHDRHLVAKIPVSPEGWRDDNDLRTRASAWLQQQATNPKRRP
ncbi:hypothetical protein [Saccharopolyspora endophytica]|uniref:Uncharacterized protein n=1 Tax=Saccharopolyspora endophytica TaxID=543886 RepID=A0ABS5DQQ6_9PSEU|nr:hypothetical protein [Saccharopolyspora endophytica]MBQ0928641.1 hypothetical protein [Saccharopolyspora endophytica]